MAFSNQQKSVLCIVAICRECRQAVIFRYGIYVLRHVTASGIPLQQAKPNIEWCDCGSDEPRHLCKVKEDDTPGLLNKCEKCEFRYSCAASRIEVVYDGYK